MSKDLAMEKGQVLRGFDRCCKVYLTNKEKL